MPTATNNGSNIAPVPAGTYLGICYGVYDIGTTTRQTNFQPRRKVLLTFELPHLRADFEQDGKKVNKARVISGSFTLSTDKKANLRKQLASWRGRDFTPDEAKRFEVANVCGHAALLSIVHNPSQDGSRIFANIASIMRPMQGTVVPPLENPKVVFDIPKTAPVVIPETIPQWIANQIKESMEYMELMHPDHATSKKIEPTEAEMANQGSGDLDADCPF